MTFQAKENYLKNNEDLDRTEKSRVEQEWVSTDMREQSDITLLPTAGSLHAPTHDSTCANRVGLSQSTQLLRGLNRSAPGHANVPVSYTSLFFCLGCIPEEHTAFS